MLTREVVKKYGVSKSTLLYWVKSGLIRAKAPGKGRKLFWDDTALDDLEKILKAKANSRSRGRRVKVKEPEIALSDVIRKIAKVVAAMEREINDLKKRNAELQMQVRTLQQEKHRIAVENKMEEIKRALVTFGD